MAHSSTVQRLSNQAMVGNRRMTIGYRGRSKKSEQAFQNRKVYFIFAPMLINNSIKNE